MPFRTYFTFRFAAAATPALLTVLAVLAAVSADSADGLEPGGRYEARGIVDGDTLVLEDGREVRLVGIQAPKLPLGRKNFRAWPLADAARATLAELALGKRLRLSFGGRRIDRHGRILAHLHDEKQTWIQGELLRRGMARVYTFPDNRAVASEMLALERKARVARRGIWAHPFYAIRDADRIGNEQDSFQLVEGRVLDVATVRGRTYVNFGRDWRTDFTISVSRRDGPTFEESNMRLEDLKGRLVRVRGWLRWRNGPMIEATHPEQIEILE